MRLTALAMPRTQMTVSRGARSEEIEMIPAKGIRRNTMVMPSRYRTLAASTMPAVLAGAETGRTSSKVPTAHMSTAATTTPSGMDGASNTAENACSRVAARNAARRPPSMARLPRRGVGIRWTRRSSGSTTAPERTASQRATGVRTNVTPSATRKTRM